MPGSSKKPVTTMVADAVMRRVLAVGRVLRRKLRARAPFPEFELPADAREDYPIAVYFADNADARYQIDQWLSVFRMVNETLPILIVTRSYEFFHSLAKTSPVDVAFVLAIDGLRKLYSQKGVKVVIYVNNGWRNFQSLQYQRALHVHVNHGESDKISMVSNQAKAYDHVVVAGQAAIDRHERALIGFDLEHLVHCGRPQLDLEVPPTLFRQEGVATILYAPTWSGESDENNYTSVARYGLAIVDSILGRPGTRLVYKPHPRIAIQDPDPKVGAIHSQILQRIEVANRRGPIRHEAPLRADILSVFPAADLLISDVSSVGLDFLYLRGDAPILLTDRRTDRTLLMRETPLARAVDVIDEDTVGSLSTLLGANLADDPHAAERREVRDYYFGFEPGESTARFIEFLTDEIALRNKLLSELQSEHG